MPYYVEESTTNTNIFISAPKTNYHRKEIQKTFPTLIPIISFQRKTLFVHTSVAPGFFSAHFSKCYKSFT